MNHPHAGNGITKTTLRLLALGLVLVVTTGPSRAAIKTWKSSPISLAWSDPDHWEPHGVPQNGDILLFDGGWLQLGEGHNGLMVNDLPNLTVASLVFWFGFVGPGREDWQLLGNPLGISNRIVLPNSDDESVVID